MTALVTGLNDLSDEELAVLAHDKNEEAFTRLVSRCSGMLKALSAKYCTDSWDPEDLLQEGLLGLLSAVQTYRPETEVAFRTYAYACAHNRMISALRRSGIEADSLQEKDEPVSDSGHDDPALLLVRNEELLQLRERLRAGLSALEYRVLMAHLSGYSYREIAEQLGITEKAVDNARQRLRRKLAPSLL